MKKIDINRDWIANFVIIAIVLLCIFFIYAFSGCKMSEKQINKFKQEYCKDSVSVVIKERTVKIPVYYADSSMLEIWLQCDSMGNVYYTNWKQIEGKYTQIKGKLDSNIIKVKTILHIKDSVRYLERDTNKYQQAQVTTNVLTNTQEFWIKAGKWLFSIMIIIFVALFTYLFFRFKKKILAFFKK